MNENAYFFSWNFTTPISCLIKGSNWASSFASSRNFIASCGLLLKPHSRPTWSIGKWHLQFNIACFKPNLGWLEIKASQKYKIYPLISWVALKYAAMAWSCSLSLAKEWPNKSQDGPNSGSRPRDLFKCLLALSFFPAVQKIKGKKMMYWFYKYACDCLTIQIIESSHTIPGKRLLWKNIS